MAVTFLNIDSSASQNPGQDTFEVTATDYAALVAAGNANASVVTGQYGNFILYSAYMTNDARRYVKIYSNGIVDDAPADPGVVEDV